MTILKGWFYFLTIVTAFASPESLRVHLSKKEFVPGERIRFEVEFPRPDELNDTEDEFTINDSLLLDSADIEVFKRKITSFDTHNTVEYEFTSYQIGLKRIPPIEFTYKGKSHSTESLKIEVLSSREPNDMVLRKGFEKVAIPISWLKTVLMVGLVCFMGGLLFIIFKRRKKISPIPVKIETTVEVPPLEWLRKHLIEFHGSIDGRENDESLMDQFSLLLKTYFEKKSGLLIKGLTTIELIRRQNDPIFKMFVPVLRECDEYKFNPKTKIDSPRIRALSLVCHCERVLCGL